MARAISNSCSRSQTDGSLRSGSYYIPIPGFQNGVAFTHIVTGADVSDEIPDIHCTFDFGFPWEYTNDPPSITKIDFRSCFFTRSRMDWVCYRCVPPMGPASLHPPGWIGFSVWDSKLMKRSAGTLLWTGNPPLFQGVPGDLTSDNVCYNGASAIDGFELQGGSGRPGVHAPPAWAEGSSMSHFNAMLTGRSVMEPFVSYGEQRRSYSEVDLGALRDIGYVNATAAVSVVAFRAMY